MIEFTPEEKNYLKTFVIHDLEDRIGLPGMTDDEATLLFNITGKLRQLCGAPKKELADA